MLSVNPYDQRVASCLLDFCGFGTPWQRRLWAVGTALGLKEVLEGSEAFQSGVLSQRSFQDLCQTVEISAGQDPGAGDPEERRLLQASLRSLPRRDGADYLLIREILSRMEEQYLHRWCHILRDPGARPKAERTARGIATFLLDGGFSETYLHRWWTYRIRHEPDERSLSDLVGDAHELASRPLGEFEILVAFKSAPGTGPSMPPNWQTPTAVSDWLSRNHFDPRDVRQAGGLMLQVSARDVHAAVEHVSEIVERLSARVNLGTRSPLQPLAQAWVHGEDHPFSLHRTGRGVEVRTLVREKRLYSDSSTSSIDAALELIGSLNEGPPGPAVAGGWAALEALLLGPGDGGDRGIAGDRLAALVACSFPRAELTTLAYSHSKRAKDPLAERIRAAGSNRERASLIAEAIVRGQPLLLASDSDCVAVARLRTLLAQPKAALHDLEQYVCRTLRRLYRQRNLVLHWGRMNAVCLRAALRTAAPLIGAGVDRIAHAWFTSRTSPLELAARAKLRLELLGTSGGGSPVELLES